MRNTKNTIKHLWNYLQNQTKSLGTIWKTHKIPRGLCWNSLRHGGGYMTYVFTFAQNRKFWYFSGEPPLNIKPSCQHQRHHSNTFWKLPSNSLFVSEYPISKRKNWIKSCCDFATSILPKAGNQGY
jgi:hypothetical protein